MLFIDLIKAVYHDFGGRQRFFLFSTTHRGNDAGGRALRGLKLEVWWTVLGIVFPYETIKT
jgi:hypothetical protein